MFDGYLSFGGNEIINSPRAWALSQLAECSTSWFKKPKCETLAAALRVPGYDVSGYSTAPWYDPAHPDLSERFFGLYGLDLQQVDDVEREVQITEGIRDGAVVGRTRLPAKRIRARAFALADGEDAMSHGMAWLRGALAPGACGQHGNRCGVTDLEMFTDCPPERPNHVTLGDPVTNEITDPRFTSESFTYLSDLEVESESPFLRVRQIGEYSGWVGNAYPINDSYAWFAHVLSVNWEDIGNIGRIRINVQFFGPSGSISTSDGYIDRSDSPEGGRFGFRAEIPAGTTEARIYIRPYQVDSFLAPSIGSEVVIYEWFLAQTESETPAEDLELALTYFDGSFEGSDTYDYSWSGDPDESQSYRQERFLVPYDDDEYAEVVREGKRYLHEVTVESGPLEIERFKSKNIVGREIEFTFVAGKAFLYGPTVPKQLPSSATTIVEDVMYNLVTTPRPGHLPTVEFTGNIVAVNYIENPSAETNLTGITWDDAAITGTRPSNNSRITHERSTDLAVAGTYSSLLRLTGATSVSNPRSKARMWVTQTSASIPAGMRMVASVWAAGIIAAAPDHSSVNSIKATFTSIIGGSSEVFDVVTITDPDEINGFVFESIPKVMSAAGTIRIEVEAEVEWTSGSVAANNSDIRLYTDAFIVTDG